MKNVFSIFLISLLILFTFLNAQAQRSDLVFSSEKNSDDYGMYKLKILKNGNTAHVGLEKKAGFFFTIYDVNKKKIANTILPTDYEVDMFILKAMFEIDNDVILMMQVYAKGGPRLTRYIFDGSTGKLKKQEIVATMPDMKTKAKAYNWRMDEPDFYVQKDVNSDNYAIVCFDSFSEDMNKAIEVIHFTPTHQIITRAYLPIPEIKYSDFRFTDILVNGANSVIIASYLFYKKGKDDEACFYLSELKAGQTIFKSKRSVETLRYYHGEANFLYNKITKTVKLITTVLLSDPQSKINGYITMSQTLNLETLVLSDVLLLYSNKVDEMYRVFLPKLHYAGLVQNLCIDSKGNTIVLSEMITVYTNGDSRSMEAEEIGLSSFSPSGKEQYGQLVHYKHAQILRYVSLIYTKVPGGQYRYPIMDEFNGTYLGLISGEKNNYMFLNNTPERSEKPIDVWPGFYASVRPGNDFFTSYIYTMNETGIVSKDFIFGKPTLPDSKYCLFNTADYNPTTGMYAVVVIDRINGKKMAGVVWMNLK